MLLRPEPRRYQFGLMEVLDTDLIFSKLLLSVQISFGLVDQFFGLSPVRDKLESRT